MAKEDKGFSVAETKKDFDKLFGQLKQVEKNALEWEKVSLFLQEVDKRYNKDLELLLEDATTEDGITTEWDEVRSA